MPALPAELPRDAGGAVNKQALGDATYRYILEHTREAEVLRELRQATEARFPRALRMQVSEGGGSSAARARDSPPPWSAGTHTFCRSHPAAALLLPRSGQP